MDVAVPASRPADDSLRRQRAKQRLYVLAQTVGWLGLLALQLVFVQLVGNEDRSLRRDGLFIRYGVVVLLGWLLTHYVRPLLHRWGWKDFGWRRLFPRVAGLAALLALLWVVLSYSLLVAVLREPLLGKPSVGLALAVSWVNGLFLMGTWLGGYFFFHLFDRFNRLEIERFRLQASVKEAELRALRSQINPHFIFNSLNSLRALIEENPARAREAVTQLANLLRYSLQAGQLETVTLAEEWRVVNDYLALEQVRHEDRLRVQVEISAEAAAATVPPMLLQTLVENAVKYGIAPRREGGEIAIAARCTAAGLQLRVTNPGTLAPAAATGSTGLGLSNAAERLRLQFGERARLALRAEAPDRVVAEVEVPAATAGGLA